MAQYVEDFQFSKEISRNGQGPTQKTDKFLVENIIDPHKRKKNF